MQRLLINSYGERPDTPSYNIAPILFIHNIVLENDNLKYWYKILY